MNKKEIYLICRGTYDYEVALFYFENLEDAQSYVDNENNENEYYNDSKLYIKKIHKY
ncbi:hypothetical protein [Methanobrevibacter sp.]|uniref:hypothetical protein n=1 Tax=Methanobrevibacter sp. TaxID=66852 RepID=UPI003865E303